MCNQKKRDLYEFDSPNAELFKELGKLYGENIQDLSQALKPSLSRPELNDQAIQIIKQSRMFKHMEDVKRDTPWVFDDEEFLNHYPATKDALHFLYSNFEHYDNTFIPCYRQLHAQLTVISNYNKDNTLLKFMQEYIAKMVEEAIVCRKRFAELFRMVLKERREDTVKFIEKYNRYPEIDYIPKVLDISFLVDDVLKAFERHRE